jgi:hypothetical protein
VAETYLKPAMQYGVEEGSQIRLSRGYGLNVSGIHRETVNRSLSVAFLSAVWLPNEHAAHLQRFSNVSAHRKTGDQIPF